MRARYVVRISPADVGRRVSIRARTHAQPPATDTVGVLHAWQDGWLQVERRDGTVVRLPEVDLLAARVVPDAPPPRHRG